MVGPKRGGELMQEKKKNSRKYKMTVRCHHQKRKKESREQKEQENREQKDRERRERKEEKERR